MKRVLLAVATLLVALPISTEAILHRMTLDEMIVGAPTIVEGEVVSRSSRWDDNRSGIITEIEIAVSETHKGRTAKGETLVLTTRGGQVGDIVHAVEHQPLFGKQEKVLLFVRATEDGGLKVYNDIQGKYALGTKYIVRFDHQAFEADEFRRELKARIGDGGDGR